MVFIRYFEDHDSLSCTCNSSFITLAPKTKDLISLNDFRPISLIGCLYMIISKILSTRIKPVVGKIIGEVQSVYVDGRNILDGPLIVNEIFAWAKKIKKQVLLFKVDFDKAFDSVNWGFLESILSQMGFNNRWRGWICGCLSSSRASVIINGAPAREFNITRGVHQGNPLSPFLFIIAMEGLNVAFKPDVEKGIFNGINILGGGPPVSHIFYADETLFMGEWSRSNLKILLVSSIVYMRLLVLKLISINLEFLGLLSLLKKH